MGSPRGSGAEGTVEDQGGSPHRGAQAQVRSQVGAGGSQDHRSAQAEGWRCLRQGRAVRQPEASGLSFQGRKHTRVSATPMTIIKVVVLYFSSLFIYLRITGADSHASTRTRNPRGLLLWRPHGL